MRICVIAGGVGSARFCCGLASVVDPADLVIVVNVADDDRMRGVHVSPDVDTVLYHLAHLTDWGRGWGVGDESYAVDTAYRELVARAGEAGVEVVEGAGEASVEVVEGAGEPGVDLHEWFTLGDRDLATNLLRSRLLDAGRSMSEATDVVRRALGVAPRVVPATDAPVRTIVRTTRGERLDFQTYFVRRGHADEIGEIEVSGAEEARPAPGVLEAIEGADVVLVPPSNPLLSIRPVLAIDRIRSAIADARAVRVAVSPIVGGRAIKGPADSLLGSLGHEVSAVGVARIYRGLVDVFVCDTADADRAEDVERLGMRAVVCDTIMRGPEDARRLAKEVLHALA